MIQRIFATVGVILLTSGVLTGVTRAWAAEIEHVEGYGGMAEEDGAVCEDGGCDKGECDGRCTFPRKRRKPPYGGRIPPEWRREHRPMPLPENSEDKASEIPDRPEGDSEDASVSENTAYGWYCMRNSTHTLPPIDRGMEFITDCNAIYADTEAAKKGDKVIYLTFDAGYENGNVAKILDVLKKHNATGAFFILENLIKREPQLVKRMADEGHLVCNHTLSHPDMTKVDTIEKFSEQVTGLEKLALDTLGIEMAKFYRPPEGRFSRRDLEFAKELGYKTVFWSFAYADWDNGKQPSTQYAENKILENAHPGEIMLLHPTSATNAAVLDSVLTKLENEGYRFGSLDSII